MYISQLPLGDNLYHLYVLKNHKVLFLSFCDSRSGDCLSLTHQALLKMDCQGLVARLILDFVLLTTAVEVATRWRELAEKLARVSRQQMEAYEAPHCDRSGVLDSEVGARH